MLVIETSAAKVTKRIDLEGDFQFDAVSNDGQRLYLIQYLSSTEYNVRLYDIVPGLLDVNIVVDKADGNQAMAGLRLSGVASPDGHWLYSMYVRENQSPFIHALSMDGPFAFCIDLPGNGYASGNGADEFHWSLAMSPDGSRLYAANGALGLIADVEPATSYQPAIKRLAHIDTASSPVALVKNAEAKELGANAATVTPDGRTLIVSGGMGIVWVDTGTLRARDRALTDWRVWSLGLSADGSRLYVVNDAGMIAETSMTPDHLTTRFGGAPGQPIALIRVAAGGS
jgi:DNA-binding beta-propeller fold protein YncE